MSALDQPVKSNDATFSNAWGGMGVDFDAWAQKSPKLDTNPSPAAEKALPKFTQDAKGFTFEGNPALLAAAGGGHSGLDAAGRAAVDATVFKHTNT
jgi:hypothetical protein